MVKTKSIRIIVTIEGYKRFFGVFTNQDMYKSGKSIEKATLSILASVDVNLLFALNSTEWQTVKKLARVWDIIFYETNEIPGRLTWPER